jgi:hypothetical protein
MAAVCGNAGQTTLARTNRIAHFRIPQTSSRAADVLSGIVGNRAPVSQPEDIFFGSESILLQMAFRSMKDFSTRPLYKHALKARCYDDRGVIQRERDAQ